jgi:iron complex transport system ATP-binding protein
MMSESSMNARPILTAESITVRIGAAKLLDDVSLALVPGEIVALVGPNGAGKSTLLRVLSGELAPGAGIVRLNGVLLASYAPRELALRRAVLAQSVSVVFSFTVAEIVRMGAGDGHSPRIDAMVDAALAEVDLGGFRERAITTLSGGEQQRAHLARVLVQLACGEAEHGPGVLLLDEPTASLDLRHQLGVVAVARACAERGVAVVAILHDLNLAALLADRMLVLDRGRIDSAGVPADIITDAMLARVFAVADAIGRVPAGLPFVLPHAAATVPQPGTGRQH